MPVSGNAPGPHCAFGVTEASAFGMLDVSGNAQTRRATRRTDRRQRATRPLSVDIFRRYRSVSHSDDLRPTFAVRVGQTLGGCQLGSRPVSPSSLSSGGALSATGTTGPNRLPSRGASNDATNDAAASMSGTDRSYGWPVARAMSQ